MIPKLNQNDLPSPDAPGNEPSSSLVSIPQILKTLSALSALMTGFLFASGLAAGWTFCLVLINLLMVALLYAWNPVPQEEAPLLPDSSQQDQREMGEILQGMLDSSKSHVAILSRDGTILHVNRTWRDFMAANGGTEETCGVGANYLAYNRRDFDGISLEELTFERGFKSLLDEDVDEFVTEYACHSPKEERWFSARVTLFPSKKRRWVVVSHEDITARKRAELEVKRLQNEQYIQCRLDSLTGLGNRLRLKEDLEVMKGRLERYGRSYSIALFDVDGFADYNEHYGHHKGDEALRAIADTIRQHCRSGDTAYRYGGEEFMLILPEQSVREAAIAAIRMCRAIESLRIPHAGNPATGTLTISVGVSAVRHTEEKTVEELINEADDALYDAKTNGRNRVEVYQPVRLDSII